MLKSFRRNRRLARVVMVGMALLALAAPALAEHFDWNTFLSSVPDPAVVLTAEDAHMECPEDPEAEEVTDPPVEGASETVSEDDEAEMTCDQAVQEAAEALQSYDHPENHGKYVSFVAHCLKGMKGKGQVMRQIAHADEDEQQEMAVRLCAEWTLAQSQAEGDDSEADDPRGKKDKHDDEDDDEAESVDDADDDDPEVESASDDEDDDAGNRGKSRSRARKGRGRR